VLPGTKEFQNLAHAHIVKMFAEYKIVSRLPHISIAIFAQTFIIEPVPVTCFQATRSAYNLHLRNLPTFMVASQNSYSILVAYFECHQ
jgi:hypothetical protein